MNNNPGIKTAVLISFMFFIVGLLTMNDYAWTYDEFESYFAGNNNIRIICNFLRNESADWGIRYIHGYQFFFDTIRSMTAYGLNYLIGDKESFWGFHFFNLLVSSSVLFITFLTGRDVSRNPAIGWFAAAILALHPKFIAHSQANPKDMIGAFVIMLSVWMMIRAGQSNNWKTSIGLAMSLGLALASHLASVILYPLGAIWLFAANKRGNMHFFLRITAVFLVSLLIAFLLWPWLWTDPYNLTLDLINKVRHYHSHDVLYLGEIYKSHYLPWHYSLVSVIISTPSLIIITAAAGIIGLKEKNKNIRQLTSLSLLLMSFIFIAEGMSSIHYDGVRHVLAVLPALALLSGCGLYWIGNSIRQLFIKRRFMAASAFAIVLAATFISIPMQLWEIHPYYDAYLNEGTRMAAGSHAENTFELEYWCFTYKEASKWLNEKVPHGAVVLTPIASPAMKPLLRKDILTSLSASYKGPCYMVIMKRPALFNDLIINIRAMLSPVFTITRQDSVLLEIYCFDY